MYDWFKTNELRTEKYILCTYALLWVQTNDYDDEANDRASPIRFRILIYAIRPNDLSGPSSRILFGTFVGGI